MEYRQTEHDSVSILWSRPPDYTLTLPNAGHILFVVPVGSIPLPRVLWSIASPFVVEIIAHSSVLGRSGEIGSGG